MFGNKTKLVNILREDLKISIALTRQLMDENNRLRKLVMDEHSKAKANPVLQTNDRRIGFK